VNKFEKDITVFIFPKILMLNLMQLARAILPGGWLKTLVVD
jgi:hypothetical protein